jgi:hypothetical protein
VQKGADFVKAYALGFDVNVSDAMSSSTAAVGDVLPRTATEHKSHQAAPQFLFHGMLTALSTGRPRPVEVGRPIPRLFRDQGRENAPR